MSLLQNNYVGFKKNHVDSGYLFHNYCGNSCELSFLQVQSALLIGLIMGPIE